MDDRSLIARGLCAEIHSYVRRACRDAEACTLDDGEATGEIDIALPRAALAGAPRVLARYCRELDLKLVQLLRHEPQAWHAVLAWNDEVGRPRFLSVEVYADWYRRGILLQRSAELLADAPAVSAERRFAHELLRRLSARELRPEHGRRISALWAEDPRGALEQVARFWRRAPDVRLVAHAARAGDWGAVASAAPRLRRALALGTPFRLRSLAGRARRALVRALEPAGAALAFVGSDKARREAVRDAVVGELAPAFPHGVSALAYAPDDELWGASVRIRLGGEPVFAAAAAARGVVLRWLESRVERRFPELLVGRNPPAARFLQRVTRRRLPLVTRAVETVLNCDIEAPLFAPVLMPHPYGIVIERGAQLGHRVTVMQQVTIARTEAGAPVIEDGVVIGAGARILGAVRVGRNAVIGANAVVTRDVESHCQVDEPQGAPEEAVAVPRRRWEKPRAVVNS